MGRRTRFGFTVIELLVVIGIIALIISILLPMLNRTRGSSGRVKCASNLRQIGQGLTLYHNDFGEYPRMQWDPAQPCQTQFDNAGFNSPDGSTVNPNNVTAALFLLVRHCDINPEVFVCPQTKHEKDTLGGQSVKQRSNFTSANNVSYSFTNPYPRQEMRRVGYHWLQRVPEDFAIAADRNDGTRDPAITAQSPLASQRKLNSSNHDREGQYVLFNDGHVEWAANAWVGANRDNIYTRAKVVQTPQGAAQADPPATDPAGFPEPALDLDTVLLPVFEGR